MPDQISWQDGAVGLGLSLVVAFVVAQLAARAVRFGLSTVSGDTDRRAFRDPIQRRPIRIIRGLVFLVALALVTPPVLEMLGVDLAYGIPLESATAWLFQQGLRVVLISVLAYFTIRVAALGVSHFKEVVRAQTKDSVDKMEFAQRLQTIGGLVRNVVTVLVIAVAALMIMQELGVNITPLLTAAGIGGLAVGFGAQNLVRDVISGFFLILEDQIHIGDVVSVDGTAGLVQAVKLRMIVLRDLTGTVHVIPNGTINTLSNMTKEFSCYVIDVGVAYKEDTDHVVEVLHEVGDDLNKDPIFSRHILDKLEVLGVNDFADSAVTIKIRIKTRPLKQWMVGRELRRRIKKAFDAQGIEIPFPHTSIYFGEASKPFLTQPVDAAEVERATALKPDVERPKRRASTSGDSEDSGDIGEIG